MSNNKTRIANLLMTDPMTGDNLVVSSDLITDGKSRYAFLVRNPKTGAVYQHTVKTEEVDYEKPHFDDDYSDFYETFENLEEQASEAHFREDARDPNVFRG